MRVLPAGGCMRSGSHHRATFLLSRVSIRLSSHAIHQLRSLTGHDSSINIVYPGGPAIHNIRMPSLPLVSLIWTSEDTIVAAGHDCRPLVFSGSEAGWQEAGTLDDATVPKSESRSAFGGASSVGRLKAGAFATFRDADTRGQTSSSSTTGDALLTIHQNTITNVRAYDYSGTNVSRVSTSGVDGMLIIWDVDAVSALTARVGGAHLR